ncbi:MAG: heavy metal-associated domain-containing protein, partial [Bacilli bacterium]
MKSVFNVEGMSCASCQVHVEQAVNKLPGIKSATVSLLTNELIV